MSIETLLLTRKKFGGTVAGMKKNRTPNKVLRDFRLSLGLTGVQMAKEAGLTNVLISQVEHGTYKLGHKSALRLMDTYRAELAERRITLEDLLRGAEPQKRKRSVA